MPALLIVLGLLLTVTGACTKSEAQLAQEALQRGIEAHRAGNVVEAENNYRTAVRHDPANVSAYYNLGLLHHEAGRSFEAENHYRLALTYDPDNAPALFNLALLRAAAGSHAEAVDIWQRYISHRPDDANGHYNLSLSLRQLGRDDEADQALEVARALDPAIAPPPSP